MHFGLKQFYFPFLLDLYSPFPAMQRLSFITGKTSSMCIFKSHDPSKGNIKLVKGKRRDSRMKPSSYSWPKLIPTLPPIKFDQSLK